MTQIAPLPLRGAGATIPAHPRTRLGSATPRTRISQIVNAVVMSDFAGQRNRARLTDKKNPAGIMCADESLFPKWLPVAAMTLAGWFRGSANRHQCGPAAVAGGRETSGLRAQLGFAGGQERRGCGDGPTARWPRNFPIPPFPIRTRTKSARTKRHVSGQRRLDRSYDTIFAVNQLIEIGGKRQGPPGLRPGGRDRRAGAFFRCAPPAGSRRDQSLRRRAARGRK